MHAGKLHAANDVYFHDCIAEGVHDNWPPLFLRGQSGNPTWH